MQPESGRLLLVTPRPPDATGGVERVCREVVPRLARSWDIEWICGEPGIRRAQKRDWQGIPLRVLPLRGPDGLNLLGGLGSAVRDLEPDVVHVHNYSFASFPAIARRFAHRAPVLVTPHFHPTGSNPAWKAARPVYDALAGSPALERAAAVTAVSRFERELLRRRFPRAPDAVVVGNGVDARAFATGAAPPDEGAYDLFVGRLHRYKGVRALPAYAKARGPERRVVVVGEGPEAAWLQRASHSLDGRLELRGRVGDEELRSLLSGAAVVLQPSRIESFGLTALEALAAGRPVLVDDAPTALLELAEAFPDAVRAVPFWQDSERAAQAAREVEGTAVDVDLSRYSWDEVAKRYHAALQAAMAGDVCASSTHAVS